ncbi:hypothetical protein [Sulfuriroseicoccus oceanibius]|uniref:Uncharacterized protein n=1 Tax=Sulfuriroseicoccus oceanibius TaxID=2707525 RepID=A0A6B3LBH6_9BACT|nr:hypothetical protein [Sulfuriroseicoccus oceanibius]QQL44490.1 hypothetical protein G3M56_011450 [Sulfuriroseicoccus oceanibius]
MRPLLTVALLCLLFVGRESLAQAAPNVVRPLQEIGVFRVSAMWRVSNGELIPSAIEPYDYRVLSNGERIELELVDGDSKRISFAVYRAGTRMIVEDGLDGIATAEALLASSKDDGTLRQVVLTPKMLRITRMPVNSMDIIVIEAHKVPAKNKNTPSS